MLQKNVSATHSPINNAVVNKIEAELTKKAAENSISYLAITKKILII
jgi:hypothetical protein